MSTVADVAVDAGKGPVLFLEILAAPAAVDMWEEEEGQRGVRDGSAAAWDKFDQQ